MNSFERFKKSESVLSFFNMAESSNINKVRINEHNSYEHERFKFELAYLCKKKGFNFLVEPRLKNNLGQPDFCILEVMWLIEILNSESLESCQEKVKKYPKAFKVKIIDSRKEFPENLI